MALALRSHSETFPDRETWLRGRASGLGASDAPIVLGESDWDSPYGLYCKKLGLVPYDPSESLAMEIGRFMEAGAATIYERRTGRECFDLGAFTIQRHKTFPALSCTLDRVVYDVNRGWGCLNLKCVGGAKADEWTETPPRIYWIQEQAELLVSGLKWASLGVIVSNYDFRWCDVERDDAFIDGTLLPALLKFWAHVQCGVPPSVDGHPATSRSLSALHPCEDESTVLLPDDFYDIDADLLITKARLSDLEYKKRALENRIKSAMGECSYGLIPGRARYSWTLQNTANGGMARVLRRKAIV